MVQVEVLGTLVPSLQGTQGPGTAEALAEMALNAVDWCVAVEEWVVVWGKCCSSAPKLKHLTQQVQWLAEAGLREILVETVAVVS